jgi:YD repeat-containing protein
MTVLGGFGSFYPADRADEEIHYVRDSNNRPELTSGKAGGTVLHALFDGQGRDVGQQWLGFGANWVSSETAYDQLGRIVSRSAPHFVSDTPVLTSFAYDNLDRLTGVKNPDGSSESRTYTGLRMDVQDANSNKSYVVTDGAGRVRLSALLDANSREVITRFNYNPLNLLTRVTDAYGNATFLEYDILGRRTVVKDPDTGVTVTHFDAFDAVKDVTDGAGRKTTYSRDLLGRPQHITSSDGTATIAWDTSPHGIGELATSTSSDGVSIDYSYDPLSRIRQQSWQINGSQYEFVYSYDPVGRASTITYPGVGTAGVYLATKLHQPGRAREH